MVEQMGAFLFDLGYANDAMRNTIEEVVETFNWVWNNPKKTQPEQEKLCNSHGWRCCGSKTTVVQLHNDDCSDLFKTDQVHTGLGSIGTTPIVQTSVILMMVEMLHQTILRWNDCSISLSLNQVVTESYKRDEVGISHQIDYSVMSTFGWVLVG